MVQLLLKAPHNIIRGFRGIVEVEGESSTMEI